MSDFVIWEPGETMTCVLCGRERGGSDPPGYWMRHRPSNRRRIPIFGMRGWLVPMGYLEYVRL